MATLQWFIKNNNGKIFGPFSSSQVRKLANQKKISESTIISKSEDGPWIEACKVPSLFTKSNAIANEEFTRVPRDRKEESADDSVVKPSSKLSSLAGIVGGLVTVAIIGWNIYAVVNNTYLQTDAAAISLIQSSMEETFSEIPNIEKPVRVSSVQLIGEGENRSGTAIVHSGNTRELIRFSVILNKSFFTGLKVEWEVND